MVDVAGSVGGVMSPVLQVAEWLAAPIWRPFKYLYTYTTNFKNLEMEVDKLKKTREEVERKIIAAKRNVEVIYQNVEKWQDSAQKMIDKAEQLIREKDQFIQEKANNPRCFKGLCSNFVIHYKQSRKAFKLKRDDIDPLLQEERELGPISYQTNPTEIWLRSSENYLAFESRNSTGKNVWDALNDENVFMIGVYGMGGLGKTTLVEELGRKAEKIFDDTVFVEFSESPVVKKIQTTIAKKLGLKFENESESEMASKVYSRMKDKKILLILDNIWEPLEFEKMIGIPCGADRGKNKLLFTTRNLDVLERIGSTNNFEMGILNEGEAWTLFTKMAGIDTQTHRLHSLPNKVCKKCGGLPIVICTIGKALKNKSYPRDWRVALQEMEAHSPTNFTGLLEKEYKKIELSYKYLRNDELKKTFLIASLLENNTSISDLFKHVVCLDILEGANLKMEDQRDRLDKLVNDLKDVCLLLNGVESGQFAMHDIIRDIGITIACRDHHVFTMRNDVERDWKDKDKLNKCRKISLPGNSTIISQLWPNDLDCPNLEYVYMTNMWNSSFKIPNNFFTVMPNLKVLNLVGLQQSSLPSSIDLLANLQTLWLDYSKVEDVVVIGKLKKLKVLSLRGSYIKEFPTEMHQLTQLRLLDLSYCKKLEVIAPNVLSNFSQLEEFYLKECFIDCEIKVLTELQLLSKLTSLELDIHDDKVLSKDFFSRELIRYKISVGNWWYQCPKIDQRECLKVLKLIINPTIDLEELDGIKNVELLCLAKNLDDEGKEIAPLFNKKVIFLDLKVLALKNIISKKIWDSQLPFSSFENLKELILWGCTKIKFVFPYIITNNLQQLQYLEIKDCIDLEEIVATEEIIEAAASFVFPQVTFIKLENLPELSTFYPGIHNLEWPKLKKLEVKDCDKIKVFSSGPNSLCLDHKINHDLEVFELDTKSIMIHWSRQSNALKIYHDVSANIPLQLLQRFESLEELLLHDCRYKDIKSVSNLPNLNVLHVWLCSKLVGLVPSSTYLQNLKVLDVIGCTELVNLTTPSTVRSLVQLRELTISSCEMLMEILKIEEDAATEIVFENLNKLSFDSIKSLTCFCSRNCTFNFPSMEELNITKCPNMITFCRGILSTPKLQKINYEGMEVENERNDLNKTIQGLYKMKNQDISVDLKLLTLKDVNSTEICYNQCPTSTYQNLTHLFLWNCKNIKYAFPSSIARSLQQLQQLKIQKCKVLEGIVAKEDGSNTVADFVFPNITLFELKDLPELTIFYPGIYTIELPKLKEFVVKDCTKYVSLKENNVETELNILHPKSIFLNDKINFNLEVFDGVTNICWQSQSKTLTIYKDVAANILFRLLQRIENVRELQLSWSQYKDIESLCDLPNLEILEVDNCYRLMSLVPFSGSFQNLKVLKVSSCNRLIMKLITLSMARSLVQLRELSISHCEMLTEIVENETDATTCTEIVFNNLNKLSLKSLESLTCFYSGNYSFSFPSLEKLIIEYCPNLKIFCQGSFCTPKLDKVIYKQTYNKPEEVIEIEENDLNTTIQQKYKKEDDFFWMKLTLSGRDIMTILQGEFQEDFGKVEILQLIKDDLAHIPIHILQKFISLQELILKVSLYEEMFSCEEGEEHVGALLKLRVLQLQGLLNLRCIWNQDFRFKSILQNLRYLKVEYCHNLMTLLPSSSSFKNLAILNVKCCNGMQNLMASSTAKSLACLKCLSIEECEMMIAVLANEGDIEKDEIVFERLEDLCLFNLESLTCFYFGNYTLKFPFLESLAVKKCSKMKTFSREGVNMPNLQQVNRKYCSNDRNYVTTQLQNDCSKLWKKFPPQRHYF